MIPKEQEQLVLYIRKYITRTVKTINLKASFTRGRRKSDLLLVKLRGEREYAQAITASLAEVLSEVDIETPKSLQKDDYLTLIVTQKLADQEIVVKERRARLISNIEKELGIPDKLTNPEDLDGTLQALESSMRYVDQLRGNG